jgi:lipopolysaccharide export system permease protein
MDRITRFTLREFFGAFFQIFLILFLIVSLVFIVAISNATSSIQISFLELGALYLLSLPQILFISLSISFFLGGVSSFSQLSESQELIGLVAGGVPPLKILKGVGGVALFLTMVNLFFLFVSIPYAQNRYQNLKEIKKEEAKFTLQSRRISQKLGDWNLFIQEREGGEYRNILLYNRKEGEFVRASRASLIAKGGYLRLYLSNGALYQLDRNLTIEFKEMVINHPLPHFSISLFQFRKYWEEHRKFFATYLPVALLPIALFFLIPAVSFYHPRLNQNRHPLIEGLGILLLYLLLSQQNRTFLVGLFLPLLFGAGGFLLFQRRVRL